MKILIFVGDEYEDLEVQYPRLRLREAGFEVVLAGPGAGVLYHGKHGYPVTSDAAIADLDPGRFDGLVIPGGWLPDRLRRDPRVLALTKAIHDAHKLVASICHGPWVDISARIVKGYRYTSSPAIRDDLENAGATWADQPVVIDRNRVSSRRPDDLPEFARAILGWFAAR